MTLDSNIFNVNKKDYEEGSLILSSPAGLFDTVNKRFPEVWGAYKNCKSLDWDENEFNYSSCNVEFKTCQPSVYDMMIRTLAWQWEADSIAARAVAPIVACFNPSSELWAAYSAVGTNEVLHAITYSEIVRNSFDNPQEVLSEILSVNESLQRIETVAETMSKTYKTAHQFALGQVGDTQDTYNDVYLFFVAMLMLERIQFMASFAVTFSICDTGMFLPIGKAVQKIAQDELEVHVVLGKAVLKYEHATERGQLARIQCKTKVERMIEEIVSCELTWVDHLFSEGRELVGLNADLLKKWVLFNAKDVYTFLDLTSTRPLPEKNPLLFMENWLNIGKTQASPQEQANGQYKLNIMRRDDQEESFAIDF